MKQVILFLAANPLQTNQLTLDREASSIQQELERSGFRDRFELVTRWAVTPLDLLRELGRIRPTIVHFSGHGHGGANGRSPGAGLVLQGPDDHLQHVPVEALEQAFAAAGASVQLVVLNACYSEELVQALLRCVPGVVGMRGPIFDDASRAFSVGFYAALGERCSLARAFAHGRAAIALSGQPDHQRPQLAVRAGVEAEKLVLAGELDEPLPTAPPSPAGGAAYHASIHGGHNPIIAQHSNVIVNQPTPGQLQREQLEQRARVVTQRHLNDPVARPRAEGIPPGIYAFLFLVLAIVMAVAKLIS